MKFFEFLAWGVFELVAIFGCIFFASMWIDHAGKSPSDIDDTETDALNESLTPAPVRFDESDKLTDAIGCYEGMPIYRYVAIHDVEYQFDHVRPPESKMKLETEACWLAPGLVYLPVAPRT